MMYAERDRTDYGKEVEDLEARLVGKAGLETGLQVTLFTNGEQVL